MKIPMFLLILMLVSVLGAAAQQKSGGDALVNKGCGFRATLQRGWKMEPSSERCAFRVVVGDHDGVIEVTIKPGTAQQGASELGFTNNGERWVLDGKQSAKAEGIEGSTWTGLQGTIGAEDEKANKPDDQIRLANLVIIRRRESGRNASTQAANEPATTCDGCFRTFTHVATADPSRLLFSLCDLYH